MQSCKIPVLPIYLVQELNVSTVDKSYRAFFAERSHVHYYTPMYLEVYENGQTSVLFFKLMTSYAHDATIGI